MSDSAYASVRINARAFVPATPPIGGVHESGLSLSFGMPNGTGDGKIQNAFSVTFNLAAAGTQTIDLRAVNDANGDTVSLANVAFLAFDAPTTNPTDAPITIARGAADAWTPLLGTQPINLQSGTAIIMVCRKGNTEYPTSATDKTILLTNTSASSASVTVSGWGV